MSNKRKKRQRAKVTRKKSNIGPVQKKRNLRMAIELQQSGNPDKAEKIYKELLVRNPNNVDALHFYGILLYQRGEKKSGMDMVRRALDINPGYSHAINNLGNILKLEGELEEARALYTKAATLAPEAIEPIVNLGVLARARQEYGEAERWYRKAIGNDPEYLLGYVNLAHLLQSRGRYPEALELYQEIRRRSPVNSIDDDIWHRQARVLYLLGRTDESIEIYREWLKRNPGNATARHMLAAVADEEPPEKPDNEYVKNLFDRFAQSFDEVLDNLGYKAPQLCGELVDRYFPEPTASLKVLDAGCGTGLCGKYLTRVAAVLTGVDLSRGMLNQAQVLDQYDHLIEADLVEFLQDKHEEYDLVVSADTFCYFGALDSLVRATASSMKADAYLIFTVELTDQSATKGYRLNPHGRYSHTRDYLNKVIEKSGLRIKDINEVILRYERGEPVSGFIVSATK